LHHLYENEEFGAKTDDHAFFFFFNFASIARVSSF
jgi:hypothetical protein